MKKASNKEMAVMVTTDKRGVFFGYTDDPTGWEKHPNKIIKLKRVRNCVYWSADVKGFLGLTTTGPTASCKIGPACPELTLPGVESVASLTQEAVAAWEAMPWGR